MVKILRKFCVFIDQKSIFHLYCFYNVKNGIQLPAYNINKECVNHFSQFISIKVKKNLRKISRSISGKVKKIEVEADRRFSYKKRV